MRAISIRQPWAWLIVQGFKPVENRSWPTNFRGKVLVHASKGMTNDEYEDVEWLLKDDQRLHQMEIVLPDRKVIDRGGIVGITEIVGCVSAMDSPWFYGPQGFLLQNSKPLPFMPFKGALGFFNVPDDIWEKPL